MKIDFHERDANESAQALDGTVMWWTTDLDNHEPARQSTAGYGVQYIHKVNGHQGFKFWPEDIKDPLNAVYVLDNGETAIPYYVTGWNSDSETAGVTHVFLQPFPTNPGGKEKRADDGRPVDYRNWMLGPRKCYHLKIR
jgi:hypothetical protein